MPLVGDINTAKIMMLGVGGGGGGGGEVLLGELPE